jgi:hypothetical protein
MNRRGGFAVIVATCGLAVIAAVSGAPVAAFQTYSSGGSSGARTGNCASCHGDFRAASYRSFKDGALWSFTDPDTQLTTTGLHDVHRQLLRPNSCPICHTGGAFSFSPVLMDSSDGYSGLPPIGCMGCHGREEDLNTIDFSPGRGAGLRQHHQRLGAANCVRCHADASPANFTPVAENVPPAYYAQPDTERPFKPTSACDVPGGTEAYIGSSGLDNDGDVDEDAQGNAAAGLPRAADADCEVALPVEPTLTLTLNQGSFRQGDTMTLTATVTPGRSATAVDAYMMIRLSDGSVLSLQPGGGLVSGLVPYARSFVPFAFVDQVFMFTLSGTEPLGDHAWLAGMTRAGTGSIIGALDRHPFEVYRRFCEEGVCGSRGESLGRRQSR